MRSCTRAGFGLALLAHSTLLGFASAADAPFDQRIGNRMQCQGMYSKTAWRGYQDPVILTSFLTDTKMPVDSDPVVSLAVFEWEDEKLLGIIAKDGRKIYTCDEAAIQDGDCSSSDLGMFLLSSEANSSKSQMLTAAIHLKNPSFHTYDIKRTGYYCVYTEPMGDYDYSGMVVFQNTFGQLPAAQIAKLPFYGALTLFYAFMAIGWGALYYMHRHDILAVQNYITAILVFLVLEIFMTWLFYDYQNRHGFHTGAKALLMVVSVLSAGRNSFSFFLLLIVCMGYGVVKESLGRAMIAVRVLAVAHFIFGVVYAIASLSVTPENAGPIVLLVVLPLAGTLTAFYIWTLNSLGATMKDLVDRKQTVKAGMYRKLWWCILGSIIVIFAFFFFNSWSLADVSDEDFIPKNWQTRWFILDGWLNLVYLFDVAFIAWVWRPTAENKRFAMSEELAQDDEGFEIASLRDSLDFDNDDLEGGKSTDPPAYDAPLCSSHRDLPAPMPAPAPHRAEPTNIPHELDGETIFAVGEDGDDENDNERHGLTK